MAYTRKWEKPHHGLAYKMDQRVQPQARVLIITDRDELDEQIEKVFTGVQEKIYRTKKWKRFTGSIE